MEGEGDERRDRESCVCVFFYHCSICSGPSSEGLTKGNNIVKIVFFLFTPHTLLYVTRNNVTVQDPFCLALKYFG